MLIPFITNDCLHIHLKVKKTELTLENYSVFTLVVGIYRIIILYIL